MPAARNTPSGLAPPGTGVACAVGIGAAAVHVALGGPLWAAPGYFVAFAVLHAAQLGGWARRGQLNLDRGGRWAWTLLGFLPLPVLVLAATGGRAPHTLHTWAAVVLATALWRAWPGARLSAQGAAGLPGSAARLAAAPLAIAALVWLSHAPAGDEPHYLRIARSIAADGDVELSNQFTHEGFTLPRDSFIPTPPPPFHGVPSGSAGAPRYISQHLPGLSLLLVPGNVLAGRRGAVATVWICSLLLCALTAAWGLHWSLPPPAALAAALLAVVGVPAGAYTTLLFPEIPAALLLLLGAWAVRDGRTHGALAGVLALSAAAYLNARYVPAGLVIGAWGFWRCRANLAAVGLLALVPLATGYGWFLMHHELYGSWDPRAGFGVLGGWTARTSPAIAAGAVAGSLFDYRVGLFVIAPVWLVSAAGFESLRQGVVVLAGPLCATLAMAALAIMSWHGSFSPAGRFLVSALPLAAPLLGAGLAAAWRTRWKPLAAVLLGLTVAQSFVALSNPTLAWPRGEIDPPRLLLRLLWGG